MKRLRAYFLPSLAPAGELAGTTCVVIDVLRATTSIVAALAAGAKEVLPCQEIDEAQRLAGTLPSGTVLLGGERAGGKISGFDLGNSPAEFSDAAVRGKSLVMTTTNGTRALHHARAAKRVLLASFLNLEATARSLAGDDDVTLLCAGTDGQITREDVLLAGALAMLLRAPLAPSSIPGDPDLNDQAWLAVPAWLQVARAGGGRLPQLRLALGMALRDTRGGHNLIGMGLDADLTAAAQIDSAPLVAEFVPDTGRITAVASQ